MYVGVGLYVKNSVEAAAFYMKTLGLELGYHVRNEDGSYFHSELNLDGKPVLSVVEGKGGCERNVVQLGIELDSPDEVRRVFDAFCADGARVEQPVGELPWSACAASVVDRYGVRWYFSAQSHRPEDDFDPRDSQG